MYPLSRSLPIVYDFQKIKGEQEREREKERKRWREIERVFFIINIMERDR